jgi:hypothetical protein
VEKERKNVGPKPALGTKIMKRIDEVFSLVNKIIEEQAGGGFDDEKPQPKPPLQVDGIQFSQYLLSLGVGEQSEVRLYYNSNSIPIGSQIEITTSNDGTIVSPHLFVIGRIENENFGSFPLKLTGNKVNTECLVKARCAGYEAGLTVNVVTKQVAEPEGGFAFIPEDIRILKGKARKLKLVFDTRVVEAGSKIKVTTSDNRINIINSTFHSNHTFISSFIAQEIIEIKCDVPDVTATLVATVRTNRNELKALCTVKVIEKEPPQSLFNRLEFDIQKDGHQRASFSNGTVYIHCNCPVLKRYFGEDLEYLKGKEERDAIAILADTVLRCISITTAQELIKRGAVEVIKSLETELERQMELFEYEHGQKIHDMITQSPSIWKLSD